ncbi:hypothetical protein GQ53DRAFT_305049 [Thozetella sp. PMI_491]|nr:hypothetical protein GQ53DRAFT_305049 [Thozetella sp. PMI_491]
MGDSTEASGDAQLTFKVKTSGDKSHTISMAETATVLDLKTKLATEEFENISVERQRLIYSGRVMKNDDALSVYKIKAGNTIHMVKSAASNPAPTPSAASSTPTPAAVPQNMAAGTSANNLLAGLTGARFAGHANLPSMDLFGADGGMGAPPSDEQMADMLANPAIAQGMNEALNNPAFVDHLIQSNPMLANTPNARELIQSPLFRHMMTNPDAIRAAARMRRAMGGGGMGQEAFPAPGATDTTPSGAPSSEGAAAGNNANAANPFAAFPPAGAQGANAGNPFGLPPPSPEMLQQMAQIFGASATQAPADNRPPEERYAEQLRQLNDMGFYDFDQNVAALRRSGGSVQGAIEHLLGGS